MNGCTFCCWDVLVPGCCWKMLLSCEYILEVEDELAIAAANVANAAFWDRPEVEDIDEDDDEEDEEEFTDPWINWILLEFF